MSVKLEIIHVNNRCMKRTITTALFQRNIYIRCMCLSEACKELLSDPRRLTVDDSNNSTEIELELVWSMAVI